MTTFTEGREIGVTLVSAKNLPDIIRFFGHMKVYAEVSVNGTKETTKTSDVDKEGKTDPTWNFVASYKVSEVVMQLPGVNLVVKLWCKRFRGDKLIGEVKIPVKNIFDSEHESDEILSYDVEGTPNGVLNISCSFGEKIAVVPEQAPPPLSLAQKIVEGISMGLGVLGLRTD